MPSIITLSSLCTFPRPGKVGRENNMHERKRQKKKKKKKRCNWIMSWHPSQKKECLALRCLTHFLLALAPSPFSLISFRPLIYSKEALWLKSCRELYISMKHSATGPEPTHWNTYTQTPTYPAWSPVLHQRENRPRCAWTDDYILSVWAVMGICVYVFCIAKQAHVLYV